MLHVFVGRDALWTVHNKRPGRLKDCLKEFEVSKSKMLKHGFCCVCDVNVLTWDASFYTGLAASVTRGYLQVA